MKKKKKRKSQKLNTAILILILVTGLSLLLYPSFSEQYNAMHQNQIIHGYQDTVQSMDEDKYAEVRRQAIDYNTALYERNSPWALPSDMRDEYNACLDIYSNGTMAYLEIPIIGCSLAVYHGTDEAVLQTNVGHLEWSSLPIGGENTHSILSGHRGLPSAELLTNIDKMEIGDIFYIHVLDEKLTYVVDDIRVIEPHDVECLRIYEGKDYVTLLTCTPYGINSHRLLVRGERVITENAADGGILNIPNEVTEVNKAFLVAMSAVILAAIAAAVMIVPGLLRKPLPTEKMETENEDKKTD